MFTDVKVFEEARQHIAEVRSKLSDEADRQIMDAALYIIDEQLAVLESDE